MKTPLLTVALVATALVPAQIGAKQDDREPSNREKYEAKLQKPFATAVAYERTLAAALARARANDELIFGYFTRSYAP